VLLLLQLALVFLLGWLCPLSVLAPAYNYAGILLVFVGLLMAGAAVRHLRVARTTVDPHGSVSAVVTGGPYRWSRNPIYLGFLMIAIGLPMALGTWWGVLASPVFVLAVNGLVIRHEEQYLRRKFAATYEAYMARTRRWL
jgi:protein-S-isoprenylcysteine O-methyltransferase Ste14